MSGLPGLSSRFGVGASRHEDQPVQGQKHTRCKRGRGHGRWNDQLLSTSSPPFSLPSLPTGQGAAPTLPASSCPVPLEAREALNPANNMPQTLADTPTSSAASSQLSRLNTQRQASSIPMAPLESLPKHQEGGEQQVWMYPSEQMFFNAMKRKVRAYHQGLRTIEGFESTYRPFGAASPTRQCACQLW